MFKGMLGALPAIAATVGEGATRSANPVIRILRDAVVVFVYCDVRTGCLVGAFRKKNGGAEGRSCAVTRRF